MLGSSSSSVDPGGICCLSCSICDKPGNSASASRAGLGKTSSSFDHALQSYFRTECLWAKAELSLGAQAILLKIAIRSDVFLPSLGFTCVFYSEATYARLCTSQEHNILSLRWEVTLFLLCAFSHAPRLHLALSLSRKHHSQRLSWGKNYNYVRIAAGCVQTGTRCLCYVKQGSHYFCLSYLISITHSVAWVWSTPSLLGSSTMR